MSVKFNKNGEWTPINVLSKEDVTYKASSYAKPSSWSIVNSTSECVDENMLYFISEPIEFTFSINGTLYTAQKGMKWSNFKNSQYGSSVVGLYDDSPDYVFLLDSNQNITGPYVCIPTMAFGSAVAWGDRIIENYNYITENMPM